MVSRLESQIPEKEQKRKTDRGEHNLHRDMSIPTQRYRPRSNFHNITMQKAARQKKKESTGE